MKKVLILASVASMIEQFNMPNIQLLQRLGYEVHVACNFEEGNTCTKALIEKLKERLMEDQIQFFQIDFTRKVYDIKQEWRAYKQILKQVNENKYAFIHCQSPIGGVVGRLAGERTDTKIIYTAHGFHFYKGAPLFNWIIYYPIEKWLSRYTDILVTINQEDYQRAKRKLYAKHVEYVPGVGIDIEKIQSKAVDIGKIREEIGLEKDDFVLLSVGELNKNKNHEVVIRALSKVKNHKVKYIICGQGELREYLENLIKKLHLEKQIYLLGYRTDIIEIYKSVDLFIFPSKREGLSVALMEAMACGLPCIVTNIRGNSDLIQQKEQHIGKNSVNSIKSKILDSMKHTPQRYSLDYTFSQKNILDKMQRIYLQI